MSNLKDLIQGIDIEEMIGNSDIEVRDLSYDSRKVLPGTLFFAIKGYKTDGHRYIRDAIKNGAVAVVAEGREDLPDKGGISYIVVKDSRKVMALLSARFYEYPSKGLGLLGVTGTNGKTTTTYITKGILEASGKNVGLLGTLYYLIGNEKIPAPNTTPESLDLQRYLKRMIDGGVDYAVMEVSSHALALDRIAGCDFDVSIFTNLTQDHLDFHPTLEDYFQAKLRLFMDMKKGVKGQKWHNKRAIINIDDPKGSEIAKKSPVDVWTYGINNGADIRAEEIKVRDNGISLTAVTPKGRFPVFSNLIGRYNVYNILAAIGAGLSQNVPIEAIKEGIKNTKRVPGRFEKVDEGQGFTVVVDYAHTEDALIRLLETTSEFTAGRVITVFGCGGDRDRGKRPLMGKAAAQFSDIVIITSDNPRSEEPMGIIREIERGIKELISNSRLQNYFIIPDRREAIFKAIEIAKSKDTVIIAGKGHEDYQIIGDKKIHFDDREVAKEAIRIVTGKGKGCSR